MTLLIPSLGWFCKRLNLCSLGFLSVKEKLYKHCKVAADSYMRLHDEHTCVHTTLKI